MMEPSGVRMSVTPLTITPLTKGSSMKTPDFEAGWTKLWSTITAGVPNLAVVLAAVGALLIVVGVLGYLWKRRKGGQASQGIDALLWVAILGAVLCGPAIFIPIILKILELVVGLVMAIFGIAV